MIMFIYGNPHQRYYLACSLAIKIKAIPNFNTVTEINFVRDAPKLDGIDLSEKGDGTIKGSISGNVLNVACKGQIYASSGCSDMFRNCYKVITINFDNFNTSKVIDMNSMFWGCSSLTSLNLSKFNTSKVIDMCYMFKGCSNLMSINSAGLDTSKVTATQRMFRDCSKLSGEIIIMNPSVTKSQYMFENCSTELGARFTVYYVSPETKILAQDMINSKSPNSNIFLGVQEALTLCTTYRNVPKLGNADVQQGYDRDKIDLHSKVGLNVNRFDANKIIPKQINITLINGPSAMFQTQTIQHKAGEIGNLPKPDLNPKYAGQFGGYYYDQNCTIPVKPNDIVTQDIELYAKW